MVKLGGVLTSLAPLPPHIQPLLTTQLVPRGNKIGDYNYSPSHPLNLQVHEILDLSNAHGPVVRVLLKDVNGL